MTPTVAEPSSPTAPGRREIQAAAASHVAAERYGDRFLRRVFTDDEIAYCTRRRNPAPHLAGRFAAKEACSKALGTGFRDHVFWKDMGVVNEPSGRPTMVLTGGAREQLDRITPPGHQARIHLTITDDFPYAHAVVMIEAVPLVP